MNTKKTILLLLIVIFSLLNKSFAIHENVFLIFSDHPEKVRKNGKFLEGGLIKGKAIRINYYHLNAKGQKDRYIFLNLYNPNKKEAIVKLRYVYAGPDKNAMKVGHLLAKDYLIAIRDNKFKTINIPPGSRKTVISHYMPAENIVSGIIDLKLISQNSIYYTLYTNEKDEIPYYFLKDKKDVHARGFYDLPQLQYNIPFNLKEQRYSFLLGDFALGNLFSGKSLKGTYGTLINIDIKVKNPYNKSKFLYFFFQPRGGVAQGVFSVNNQLIFAPLTRAFENRFLFKIKLNKRERKNINIKTLCEGGSNYPVKIIMEVYDK